MKPLPEAPRYSSAYMSIRNRQIHRGRRWVGNCARLTQWWEGCEGLGVSVMRMKALWGLGKAF